MAKEHPDCKEIRAAIRHAESTRGKGPGEDLTWGLPTLYWGLKHNNCNESEPAPGGVGGPFTPAPAPTPPRSVRTKCSKENKVPQLQGTNADGTRNWICVAPRADAGSDGKVAEDQVPTPESALPNAGVRLSLINGDLSQFVPDAIAVEAVKDAVAKRAA